MEQSINENCTLRKPLSCCNVVKTTLCLIVLQPAGEERETHDSDDSEIFGTPPSSLVASGEADRLPADCQKGTEEPDEVMVDDYSGDEWKSIMPEVPWTANPSLLFLFLLLVVVAVGVVSVVAA